MKKSKTREEPGVIDFEEARRDRRERRRERLERKKAPQLDERALLRATKRRRNAIVATAVFLFVTAMVASSLLTLWNLHQLKKETQAGLDALLQQQGSLQNELTQLEDEEYVEQEARSELHMIYPGEIMYVVPVEEEEAEVQPDQGEDAKPW